MSTTTLKNTDTETDASSATGFGQQMQDMLENNPALFQKFFAVLTLTESSKSSGTGTGLLDVMNSVVNASGNLLSEDSASPAEPVNATTNPLFNNSHKHGAANFYKVTKGWGVQKEGGRIHTFDYSVSPTQGRTMRIFKDLLDGAAKGVVTALEAQVNSVGTDAATAAAVAVESARKKLVTLIVAAWRDVVSGQPNDFASYVYLSEKALLAVNDDVKKFLQDFNMHDDGGVCLGLVTELAASSSAIIIKKKAIKKRKDLSSLDENTIMYMNELYISHLYRKLVPKVELEAKMEEVGINSETTVILTAQAPNLEKLRSMDLADVLKALENASKADKNKVIDMFAGVTGGGESVPIARKNMVEAGIPIKVAYEMEKEAKEAGEKLEKKSEVDIYASLQKALGKLAGEEEKGSAEGNKESKPVPKILHKTVDKVMRSFEKTKKEKAALANPGKAILSSVSSLAGSASVAGMVLEAGKILEGIAGKNEKKLEDSLEATNKARDSAISEAEQILEDMKDTTGEDLKAKQKELSAMMTSIKKQKPQGFGTSKMRGMELQKDLESLTTRFGGTEMDTLRPYNTYQDLVAGANGGRALKSIALFLEGDEPIITAPRVLLQVPSYVKMMSPDLPFATSSYRTTSETEMTSFINSAQNSGLSTADKRKRTVAKSSKSGLNVWLIAMSRDQAQSKITGKTEKAIDSDQNQLLGTQTEMTSEVFMSEFTSMPMKSFSLEERGLRLTNYAYRQFQNIKTPRSAEKFLKTFGSHIPFGTQTLGGMFVRTMKMTSTKETKVSELYSAAANELNKVNNDAEYEKEGKGIAGGLFGLGGSASSQSGAKGGRVSGSTKVNSSADGTGNQDGTMNVSFESDVQCFGPKAATADGLYQQLMRNNATWTIIDRGETTSYLPVWELIEYQKGPLQFPTQVDLLKTTWEKKAMRNCMPEDSELLSTVLDDSLPSVNLFEIVSKLVNSLVPTEGNSYDMDLADDFEAVIRRAIKKETAPKINATDFSSQNGIRTSGSTVGYFDDSDYITYNDVNFGPVDTTKSIRISYAKGNGDGAKMEVRLDGQAGQLIGEFIPIRTGGWDDYRTTYFNIKDVDGVHNVTLVGKGDGVLNFEWIQLSGEGDDAFVEAEPKSLDAFVDKGFDDKKPRKFEIVQTSEYHEANVIFTEMEDLDMLNVSTSDTTKVTSDTTKVTSDTTKVNFDFTSAKRSIELTGRNTSDHLIRVCISDMIANRKDADFRMFHSLFDYYHGQDFMDLQRQLQEIDYDNGMCCLHYLAILGDESLIKKVLKINPDFAKDLRDDESKTPLDYMKNRPELKNLVLELNAAPYPTPVTTIYNISRRGPENEKHTKTVDVSSPFKSSIRVDDELEPSRYMFLQFSGIHNSHYIGMNQIIFRDVGGNDISYKNTQVDGNDVDNDTVKPVFPRKDGWWNPAGVDHSLLFDFDHVTHVKEIYFWCVNADATPKNILISEDISSAQESDKYSEDLYFQLAGEPGIDPSSVQYDGDKSCEQVIQFLNQNRPENKFDSVVSKDGNSRFVFYEEGKRTLAYNHHFGRAPDIAVDLANNTEVEGGKDIPVDLANNTEVEVGKDIPAAVTSTPAPLPAPTPAKLGANILKYRIIDKVLSPYKIKLAEEQKSVDQELKNSKRVARRRNSLALEGITDHLNFMTETIEQTKNLSVSDNKVLLKDVEDKLKKKLEYTEERVNHFDYHARWSSSYDNSYVLYEHKKAKGYYDICLDDLRRYKNIYL